MGARQHRGLRRRPRPGDDLRPVRRRGEDRDPAGDAAAKGLFHRAAVQSGSALRLQRREDGGQDRAELLLAKLGISQGQCRRHPEAALAAAAGGPGRRWAPRAAASRPVIDGAYLPHHPFDPAAPPESADVPVIISTTLEDAALRPDQLRPRRGRAEGAVGPALSRQGGAMLWRMYRSRQPEQVAVPDPGPDLHRRGLPATGRRSRPSARPRSGGAPTYMYLWSWPTPAFDGKFGAVHGHDVSATRSTTYRDTIVGVGAHDAKLMCDRLASAWVAFAKTGDPNNDADPALAGLRCDRPLDDGLQHRHPRRERPARRDPPLLGRHAAGEGPDGVAVTISAGCAAWGTAPSSATPPPAARTPASAGGGWDSRGGSRRRAGTNRPARAPAGRSARSSRHMILRQIGEAEPGERRLEPQVRSAVEHQLPFDAHIQLAAVLFELPGVEAAEVGSRRLMQSGSARSCGVFGRRRACEIGRRGRRPPCACPARCAPRSCPWRPARPAARRRRTARRRCRPGPESTTISTLMSG